MKFLHNILFPAKARQLAHYQTLNLDYCKKLDKKKVESHNMLLDMKKMKAQTKDLTKSYTETHDKQLKLIVRYERELETLYDKVDRMRTSSRSKSKKKCRPKSKKQVQPTYLPEKIVDMRNNKYCIKWKGWEEPTWEHSTAEVIRLNPHLVQAYKNYKKLLPGKCGFEC